MRGSSTITRKLSFKLSIRKSKYFGAESRFVTEVFPLRNETVTWWQGHRNTVKVTFRLNRAPADGTVPPSRFHRPGLVSLGDLPSVVGHGVDFWDNPCER